MNNREPHEYKDPVQSAASSLLGISYLFPYQRLVIANILESARHSGIPIRWAESLEKEQQQELHELEKAAEKDAQLTTTNEAAACAVSDKQDSEDGNCMGRQIIILPTGAGKSLCFQLPAMLLDRPSLVLYPILALMSDQERRLSSAGYDPILLRGGQSADEREKIWNKLKSGASRFIIANPEVLLSESMLRRLADMSIAHLVVDEAHCVSEWGESFRPDYLKINEIRSAARAPLCSAFTATASPTVMDKIQHYIFGSEGAHRICGNPDRPNIHYSCRGAILKDALVRDCLQRMPRPAIVFCSSRSKTVNLCRKLRAELNETEIRFYHAELEREEKECVEQWFFQSENGILVATCAYGMGVDKSNIRTVIHRDCPPTVEAYLQEAGRAGRDGKDSKALLIWGPEDFRHRLFLEAGPNRERYEALCAYARGQDSCRREQLLEMLGVHADYCSGCDICEGTARYGLRESEPVYDFIQRNARRYTLHSAAEKISALSHHRWEPEECVMLLREMLRSKELSFSKLWPWRKYLSPLTHHQ